MRHILTALALSALIPAAAPAQTNATKPEVPHAQVLSTNPFGAIVKWYNGEYERKVSPTTTIGASASHFTDADTTSLGLFARWYPQRAALDGFYLGARVGAFRLKTYDYQYQAPPPRAANPTGPPSPPTYPTRTERITVVPGVGTEIGYNWLLGPSQNVSVGIGFGLTRVLDDVSNHEMPNVVPSIRLINVGVAF
jgi:hypothetical protein